MQRHRLAAKRRYGIGDLYEPLAPFIRNLSQHSNGHALSMAAAMQPRQRPLGQPIGHFPQ